MHIPNNLDLRLHFANRTHYTELLQVWEESVRATHHFLPETAIAYYKPLLLNQYFDQLNLYYTKTDGRITGFIGMAGNYIQLLFIHPTARRQGIGKAMVDFGAAIFPVLEVDVNEQNFQAIKFYEKLGFKTIGRVEVDGAGKPYPLLTMRLG